MFQGAEGAEATAELRSAVSGLGITLKSFKFLIQKQCFGLRRSSFRASGFGWVLAGLLN